MVVSSLIGHGLEALATGLPTLVVAHDPYPLWPFLHERLEDPARRFDLAELEAMLARRDPHPLPRWPAERWWELRRRYLEGLTAAGATLVTPSRSLRDSLHRLAPELAALPSRVVPHGVARLPGAGLAPGPRDRRRVLVLGRVQGGKGEVLLDPLTRELAGEVEFYLLGAGAAAHRFFGRRGVHVELDYRREELPSLLARIAPELALIPATVSESFSYTLSELRMLGVPVLATAVGALAERIRDGEDGFLAPPEPAALAGRLRALLGEPDRLRAVAARAAARERRDPAAMAEDYRPLLPATARAAELRFAPVDAGTLRAAADAGRRLALAAERERLAAELARLSAELERRADWAEEQASLAAERLGWARALEQELATARAERDAVIAAHRRLEGELAAAQAWARGLDAERVRLEGELAVRSGERDRLRAELDAILGSRSWRLTAPLRALAARLRRARDRLRFRLARLCQLAARARGSLRSRGLVGTLRHLRARRAVSRARPTPSVPAARAAPALPARLPDPAAPLASVIVPVYGKLPYTSACLAALAAGAGSEPPFEVIVVDDASPDDSAERLARVGGLKLIRQPENRGFIAACHAGAAAARGEFLVFLNNDTEPRPGWLSALLSTFARHPDCGLAGAKLIYPDGRLQEAGGIVFSDGSGWNYGRFGDPADPRHEYVREADYCSGAAIAIRRALWERLGGFDPRYAPAYYEDTDLAFRVREAGLRVYYQPRAEVIHHEGVTSGTDLASGTKRFQAINQEKFRERWAEVLRRHPPPGSDPERAREHRVRHRLLVIDATVPTPDQDSGSLRLVNLMRAARELGCKVAFLADNRRHEGPYTEALQAQGIEAWYAPYAQDPVAFLAAQGPLFDSVWVSRHYVASAWLPLLRRYAPQARVIFDTVDLHFLRERRLAALAGDPALARLAERTREAELGCMREADLTVVVSPAERELLAQEAPGLPVAVVSNVHELRGRRRGFGERSGLLFVGGYQHPPNVDAARWLVESILPRLRAEIPELELHLVGSRAPPEVVRLGERPGVRFHGQLPELEPLLDGCRVALAPLRYGAGVKGKINQAMASGLPVVATTIAAEGMALADGREALIADSAEDFAAAVLRLYRDEALWLALSDAGLANVERHFSFAAARRALAAALGLPDAG
ncbi:MAG: glycosyltransferase [Xanthomonadales bacterium]|nr:glycosyltransferase [Xanthomonadales bacterium]